MAEITSLSSSVPTTPTQGRERKIVHEARFDWKSVNIRGIKFRYSQLDVPKNLRNPVIQLDHYYMGLPTFGPHKHAGLVAVSYILEDSEGSFMSDVSLSLGDILIRPGDIHWTFSNRGILHDEYPEAKSKVHGIQILLNLPEKDKCKAPRQLTVRREDIPVYENVKQGVRVRVVSGAFKHLESPKREEMAVDFTLLDCKVAAGCRFKLESKDLKSRESCWIYVLRGEGEAYDSLGKATRIVGLSSVGFSGTDGDMEIVASKDVDAGMHFLLGHAESIDEQAVWGGETCGFSGVYLKDVKAIEESRRFYNAGGFGKLAPLSERRPDHW
eukprot:CAMPEP_0197515706 /NCGR_PEP_ID=MMETSP1318-20131121/756_1 /TAXON_ID=552666 /ORGANISM="Partenskyella glossopodia, Strain RCC365" /LENGTH=326 /DNA_ID=CAMNT_0043064153 /DNA_START=92 /DNA_END=1069 /DNA_ORIENTATION=+